jgi:L-ascorbate peroxidase
LSPLLSLLPWELLEDIWEHHFFQFILSSFIVLFTCYQLLKPSQLQVFQNEVQSCWKDLLVLCQSTNLHPIFLRLAWSDCVDYDNTLTDWPYCGGANGSIRFDSDLLDASNAGLSMAIDMLAPCKQKYANISWADLMQMSAVASIYTAGGPFVDLHYGRIDIPIDIRDMDEAQEKKFRKEWKPSSPIRITSEDIRHSRSFPKAFPPYPIGEQNSATHLRILFNRLGLTTQEAVVLCGAHTIGRAFKDRTGTCPFASGDQGASKYTKSTTEIEGVAIKEGMAGGKYG